jgi:hypothetical protein
MTTLSIKWQIKVEEAQRDRAFWVITSPSHHLCRERKRTRLRLLLDTKMRRALPLSFYASQIIYILLKSMLKSTSDCRSQLVACMQTYCEPSNH